MPKRNSEARKKIEEEWRQSSNFPRKRVEKLAHELKIHPRTIWKWIPSRSNIKTVSKEIKNKKSRSKTRGGLEAFRNQYDDSIIIPRCIEEGIEKYLISKDGDPDWMTDRDFREACGIPITKWRRYADDFKHLQTSKNGETFWGHPDIIEEMRRAVMR